MNDRRSTPATRALAAGAMVAGFVPGAETPLARRATSRESALPNGAQLATWRARALEEFAARQEVRRDNRSRRYATWYRWALGWEKRRGPRTRTQRVPHADRVLLLQQERRPVSGRQWRQLRKAARRQERAA